MTTAAPILIAVGDTVIALLPAEGGTCGACRQNVRIAVNRRGHTLCSSCAAEEEETLAKANESRAMESGR